MNSAIPWSWLPRLVRFYAYFSGDPFNAYVNSNISCPRPKPPCPVGSHWVSASVAEGNRTSQCWTICSSTAADLCHLCLSHPKQKPFQVGPESLSNITAHLPASFHIKDAAIGPEGRAKNAVTLDVGDVLGQNSQQSPQIPKPPKNPQVFACPWIGFLQPGACQRNA